MSLFSSNKLPATYTFKRLIAKLVQSPSSERRINVATFREPVINLSDLPHDIMLHRVFGPKDAAAFLGVTVTQLQRMRREGVLPLPLHYSQRRYGWSMGTLLTYLDYIETRNPKYVLRRRTERNYFQPYEKSELDLLERMHSEQEWQRMDSEMERNWKEEMKLERENSSS